MQKILSLSLIALLTSCSLVPDYLRPEVPSAESWSAPTPLMASTVTADWWKSFGSAELNEYMEKALANNNDILASLQRVEQARANLKIVRADLLPSATLGAGASTTSTNPARGSNFSNDSVNADLSVAYEVDLFGFNRANTETAEAAFESAEYANDALRLIVMGDVASTYFTVLNTRERLAVADRNLAIAEDVLKITRAQFDAGRTSALEVSQQASALESSRAARASTEQQVAIAENALAVLVGEAPKTITVSSATLTGITIPVISTDQPSSLLERRPDIASAEANLRGANANIGAARAAFFPSLNLGVTGSVAAAGFSNPASTALSLASSLVAPIFQGGRLEGGLEFAEAQKLELVETYRKTVLVSFQEVENALAGVRASEQREAALAIARNEAQNAYDLSRLRYTAGSIDFQTLLDTQRVLLTAEDSYVSSRLDRLNAAVALYKALGGGWQ